MRKNMIMKTFMYSALAVILISILPFNISANDMASASLSIPVRPTDFPLTRPEIGNRAVSTGGEHTVGLKADGTVITVGSNSDGQFQTATWTGIVAVSAGSFHTIGLKFDGTVVAVGPSDNGVHGYGQCNVSSWTNIVEISASAAHTVGLKADGTVVAVGNGNYDRCNVSSWTDIVEISAGGSHTVGLKADGTVVAVGNNDDGRCNVSSWTDIVAISAGCAHTVGLKSDGTVVATGYNANGECNISEWKDIEAVSTEDFYTVGLKSDGTVIAVGHNFFGQCNVSSWTDIVAISAGGGRTVGLKADGKVIATGYNDGGQCNTQEWQLGDGLSRSQLTGIRATLNGNYIDFDQPPVIIDGRTLVPIRAVCEKLGADVYWYEPAQSVIIVKNETKLFLVIGEHKFGKLIVDKASELFGNKNLVSQEFTLDVPPQIMNGRTLLPIRAVCEAFGAQVDWNDETDTVVITCPDKIINNKNEDVAFIDDFEEYMKNLAKEQIASQKGEYKDFDNAATITIDFSDSSQLDSVREYIETKLSSARIARYTFDSPKENSISVTFGFNEGFDIDGFSAKLTKEIVQNFTDVKQTSCWTR